MHIYFYFFACVLSCYSSVCILQYGLDNVKCKGIVAPSADTHVGLENWRSRCLQSKLPPPGRTSSPQPQPQLGIGGHKVWFSPCTIERLHFCFSTRSTSRMLLYDFYASGKALFDVSAAPSPSSVTVLSHRVWLQLHSWCNAALPCLTNGAICFGT